MVRASKGESFMVTYHHVFRADRERQFIVSLQKQAVHDVLRRPVQGKPLVAMSERALKKAVASGFW